ncbi:Gfo/Idh/MocA family oxidoreductase [Burkholderia multivorans]|uniref:Gfo/Idh/MocA family protein n=1 Tax=Burkholderia cepacia complex TaxID=87882 RepID=UPI000CFFCF6A|nr:MULTISPECIES: Gfo/Idh/MocA family oxidoreductase [Burkholderia cepacia complex]MBU9206451.1 Gfo/Idh/MocA family oxidoreductase [Burkholderia multivorans]MBU9452189.1 Gfo/Idh/MocA family oxidoreductase [Burkholderia multivorans]MBU9486816.1 Gfo/Idh/MocA family oxidoreductase [Burkholderia multivorans]MBU9492888.1 Gfo/Idh/MocA family oxidoreductase [Burkholderia multivorans]MBU9516797.1 Gfo/Idh/MocA family oxidoreductase [Burkholderia multivorans]
MEQRRVRIGVAGLGRAFSLMLPTFLRDPRVQLVAACDPRDEARRQFTADFGAPAYDDVAELANDANVEIVYVASPHQFHARHTEIAAANGKHVLVEKPMALSAADCDRMIAACRAANVHLIVGHCHSFDTPYLRARELISLGDFGAVKMIQAVNYTDYLYRPRRPEELATAEGGGAVFSQAAHQVDIVRLLAGSRATRLRASVGRWDPSRPTEGAYSALIWFENGAYASLSYNGYGHFNTDEWNGWIGEMGERTSPDTYGSARRRLETLASSGDEAKLKAAGTYGGSAYKPPSSPADEPRRFHQHFGPVIVSCEHADVRPLPDSIVVYGDARRETLPLPLPAVPRAEVIDELYGAVVDGRAPLHDGEWAKGTLEMCIAMLKSSETGADVML